MNTFIITIIILAHNFFYFDASPKNVLCGNIIRRSELIYNKSNEIFSNIYYWVDYFFANSTEIVEEINELLNNTRELVIEAMTLINTSELVTDAMTLRNNTEQIVILMKEMTPDYFDASRVKANSIIAKARDIASMANLKGRNQFVEANDYSYQASYLCYTFKKLTRYGPKDLFGKFTIKLIY
ncbi:unnamed protein product [Gordionus sp. m RMFG-2023]